MGSKTSPTPTSSIEIPSFNQALAVWARIGVLSFGGPAGQIALMHRVLVDERRWISEERFLHARKEHHPPHGGRHRGDKQPVIFARVTAGDGRGRVAPDPIGDQPFALDQPAEVQS